MGTDGTNAEGMAPDEGPGVILLASSTSASATVHGRTEAIMPMAVRVRLPRDLGDPDRSVSLRTPRELSTWLRRCLGEGSRLGLVVGSDTVWCGAVRLVGVELLQDCEAEFAAVFLLENALSATDQRLLGMAVEEDEPEAFQSQRTAERVPVEMPVEVLTTSGAVVGTIRDLSTTGLRVHLKAAELGFADTADMSELARGLGSKLGTRFEVNLNHTVLGNLLVQTVQMTRLCAANGQGGMVELGGRFLNPLPADAAAFLGIALPEPGESTEEAVAREAPPAPTKRVVKRSSSQRKEVEETLEPEPALNEPMPQMHPEDRTAYSSPILGPCSHRILRAQVSCKAAGAPPGTTCQTETLGMGGVVTRMARSCVGGIAPGDEANILQISKLFTEVFGDEVTLKLHDGPLHLWSGPARVVAIHLPQDKPDAMLVTFTFGRALNPAEVTRLGLARLAG